MTPTTPAGGAPHAGPPAVADLAAARDRALVRRLADRDARAADALSMLFHAYAPAALALARRVTRQHQLAEDAVQEAFLGLWRVPASYESAKGSVRAFLLTAVHHRAVDAVRREEAYHRRQEEQVSAEPLQDAAEDVAEAVTDRAEHAARRTAVTSALAGLPGEQRLVVRMMYFDGKSQRKIADELRIPLGTVKSRALLAMRRLRSALGSPTWGEPS